VSPVVSFAGAGPGVGSVPAGLAPSVAEVAAACSCSGVGPVAAGAGLRWAASADGAAGTGAGMGSMQENESVALFVCSGVGDGV
jgi:hypothetical protein